MAIDHNQLIKLLTDKPGQTARELAAQLTVDKTEVNSLLYGKLKGKFKQDRKYRWWPSTNTNTQTPESEEQGFANTPLARLARYYLACLGQDDIGEVSVWARSKFTPDYVSLPNLPLDNFEEVFKEQDVVNLINSMRRDRSPKIMYLGYPTVIHKFTSKQGNEIHRLEPLFLLPVEFDQPNNRGNGSISNDYPIINTAVLKRFTNAGNDTLMSELLQLEEELGFVEAVGDVPDFDEIVTRLQQIRAEWPWVEECDPNLISTEPPLNEIDASGIYNRCVLLVVERKPFTQGLETELRELAKLQPSNYESTALGKLIKNQTIEVNNSLLVDNTLIEVLPMNTEQRMAVSRALTQPLTIITGPPGTGKSQVVTNLLVNAAWQGKKVLFASKNNKAVDVVETRVNNLGPRPVLLRMGSSNEYQVKLRDYLQAFSTVTADEDEQAEYEEALKSHKHIVASIVSCQEDQDKTIALRNKVDELEKNVESIREQFGDTLFYNVRDIYEADIRKKLGAYKVALDKADKNQLSLFNKLLWRFKKEESFKNLDDESQRLEKEISVLGISFPREYPSDESFVEYVTVYKKIMLVLKDVSKVIEYYNALELLQNAESLEVLSEKYRALLKRLSSNSEKFWRSWLRVSPARLKQEDRKLLSQYVSVIQMIIDAGTQRPSTQVWRQYYVLTEKVSHLLPCWAVTSLSARGKLPFTANYFDLVVFDEASQCDIASALPLLYRAKHVAVIGDPMQLSHISNVHKNQDQQLLERFDLVENYTQWAYSWNSLFDMAKSFARAEDIVNLRDHHRSHADIINFSNKFFYEGRLRVATRYEKLIRPSNNAPGVKWADVKGTTVRPANGGAINVKEAESVIQVIKNLVIERSYRGSIGVVSPFRAQANLIKELCFKDEQLQSLLDNLEFLSDTVHKFQGDERDIIIFSPVVSAGVQIQTLGFLKRNGNLFNVAITRARAMLLVVGDMSAAKNSGVEYLAEFASYADNLKNKIEEKEENLSKDLGENYPASVDRTRVSDWEVILYQALYKAGIRTIPQYPIDQYVLDLAVIDGERRLDIEVDGERYHRNWTGELCRRDQIRNQRMYELGWDVIRFWVYEIRDDMDGCVERVKKWIDKTN
jgi:very-short-patch-repair endonuclease